jgi:hypothetical protein
MDKLGILRKDDILKKLKEPIVENKIDNYHAIKWANSKSYEEIYQRNHKDHCRCD